MKGPQNREVETSSSLLREKFIRGSEYEDLSTSSVEKRKRRVIYIDFWDL